MNAKHAIEINPTDLDAITCQRLRAELFRAYVMFALGVGIVAVSIWCLVFSNWVSALILIALNAWLAAKSTAPMSARTWRDVSMVDSKITPPPPTGKPADEEGVR